MGFINSCFRLLICTDFAELLTNADQNLGSLQSQRAETVTPERFTGAVGQINCPASSLGSEMIRSDLDLLLGGNSEARKGKSQL